MFRYPCTGNISIKGFPAFLEKNITDPRANLQAFAHELGQRFDARYISLINSGSSANLAAAMAMAETLKQQNRPLEAIVAAYTFPTTISALILAGFAVRVADTEVGGFNLCPSALRRALQQKPATLVCVTHFLGFMAQIEDIVAIAREYNALVLQDACETMDLRLKDGRPVHQLGDLTTWSFYHPHHLSSYGGGAVVAADEAWHVAVDSAAHWGRACTCHINPTICPMPKGFQHNFTYVRMGVNVEMSELNACFGRFQLLRWEEYERQRCENYRILSERIGALPCFITYPAPAANGSPFVFPITCCQDDMLSVIERLAKRGLECRSLMGGATVEQPAFRHLSHDGNAHAKDLAARSFFIGMHQSIPTQDIEDMAQIFVEECGIELISTLQVRRGGRR